MLLYTLSLKHCLYSPRLLTQLHTSDLTSCTLYPLISPLAYIFNKLHYLKKSPTFTLTKIDEGFCAFLFQLHLRILKTCLIVPVLLGKCFITCPLTGGNSVSNSTLGWKQGALLYFKTLPSDSYL